MHPDYEFLVLVHRYLYYVLSEPVISDYEYDAIEKEARKHLPIDNVVHQVGSSLPSSYPKDVIVYAEGLIK